LKLKSKESRFWGRIEFLKVVVNLARKKNFPPLGGLDMIFGHFLKIKLKPGQNGYHSTTFGLPNHSEKV